LRGKRIVKSNLLIIALSGVILSSCGSKEHAAPSDASKPPPFDHTVFSEVTPMLDGSAYATSGDSRLWYLRGNKALSVTALGEVSQEVPKFAEITPVLDGSAYATPVQSNAGLWHLHAEHAEKVTEVTALTDAGERPEVSARAFYALYLSEHKKRKAAEDIVNNPPESDDAPSDPDPY
jgi:hypothetical protein